MAEERLDWRGKSINSVTPTVAATSVLVLQANPRRVGASFVNIDPGNWQFVCKGEIAIINTGIPLAPNGGAYEINLTNPYKGAISVISAGVGNISWTEDE